MEIPHPQSPDNVGNRASPAQTARLWTPWRMEYIGGDAAESGCVFCNRLASTDDVRSLILHRSEHAFVIMNLFPYNTGHVMIVPNAHVASPEVAGAASLVAIAELQGPVLRAIRRALGCDGFNLGSNIGEVAGAGIAAHMHVHVVPRWSGDANFMPILASVKVLPELIPVTYAKLRAELTRELLPTAPRVTAVALTDDVTHVLVTGSPERQRLPRAIPANDEPCWRATLRGLGERAGQVRLVGWAGPARADGAAPIALTFQWRDATPRGIEDAWLPVEQAHDTLPDPADRAALAAALANLAPPVGSSTAP